MPTVETGAGGRIFRPAEWRVDEGALFNSLL
jgi:hypothetical protein